MYMKRLNFIKSQGIQIAEKKLENPIKVKVNKNLQKASQNTNIQGFNYNNSISQKNDYFDHKWEEVKILGSNIQNRSYSSLIEYNQQLYIYGGYQIDSGILNDFWSIKLGENEDYKWQKVQENNLEYSPIKRSRHTAILYQNQMIILGGQYKTSTNDNKLFIFNLQKKQWQFVDYGQWKENCPQSIDSHSAVLDNNRMIVLCGYLGQNGQFSNGVWSYDIIQNNWQQLFENNTQKNSNLPTGRANQACALVNKKIYMFGGSDGAIRMNDFWQFDLNSNQWSSVILTDSSIIPKVRSGHSMIQFQNKLVLFGGIHDITWELDDMFYFDLQTFQWNNIDQDSARNKAILGYSPKLKKRTDQKEKNFNFKLMDGIGNEIEGFKNNKNNKNNNNNSKIQGEETQPNKIDDVTAQQIQNQKVQFAQQENSQEQHDQQLILDAGEEIFEQADKNFNQQQQFLEKNKRTASQTSSAKFQKTTQLSNKFQYMSIINNNNQHNENDGSDGENKSPTTTLKEQKKKFALQKKVEMLKLFEVDEQIKEVLSKEKSPTSQEMNNSLISIGNPSKDTKQQKQKLSELGKTTTSNFNKPLTNSARTKQGKRPCARDGHSACLFLNQKMIIFGGDRHNMSFNNIFLLDLNLAIQQND